MIRRNLLNILAKSKKSLLLLGPRQAGKSTLIRELSPELTINLMLEQTFFEFSRNPSELQNRLQASKARRIFIDEIQRLPSLLNTIQVLIDDASSPRQFLLTGSSARKLKRGSANLLPGRLHVHQLGPLVSSELAYQIDEKKALAYGTLPGIYTEEDEHTNQQTLISYAATYLREEIQAEGLTKNIEGFSRFLSLAAIESANFLDVSKIASEAGVPRQTATRFFEMLEDTLIVQRCDAFSGSDRKRLVRHPRFFFFDTGVLNGLLQNFTVSKDRIGKIFETLLFNQLTYSASSRGLPIRISSYRTANGSEVDFIVELAGDVWAIEAKASTNVGPSDLRGLHSFCEYYGKKCRAVVAYQGSLKKVVADVEVFPWQDLLREMGL